MRLKVMAGVLGVVIAVAPIASYAQADANVTNADSKAAANPPPPPVQSGVYGYSGAKVPYGDPEGVIGECIWIFDAEDKHQVAKGDCQENAPGSFRVVLKPGHYVVHGPGGNKPIEVKEGGWVKIESIVLLPMAP